MRSGVQARLTRPGDQPLPCVRSFVPGEAQAGYTPATHPIAAPARLRLPSPQRNYLTDCVSRRRALEFAGSFLSGPDRGAARHRAGISHEAESPAPSSKLRST